MSAPGEALETFLRLLEQPQERVPLAEAALHIARTEYPALDVAPYLERLAEMSRVVAGRLGAARDIYSQLEAINAHLFGELGFRGNQQGFYDPRNSFLNDVLEQRTGIPITLSVVYIDVGRRLGLPLAGVGLPGHFLVGYRGDGREIYIDPFHQGLLLTREDCAGRLRNCSAKGCGWRNRTWSR